MKLNLDISLANIASGLSIIAVLVSAIMWLAYLRQDVNWVTQHSLGLAEKVYELHGRQ